MTSFQARPIPTNDVEVDTSSVRDCLRCRVEFESAWIGERICSRCKSTAAWRLGGIPQAQSRGPRR